MKRAFPKPRKRPKEDMISVPVKTRVQNKITCKKCGEDSGWTNDVLAHAVGELELKCKKCGEVCVKIMCKKKHVPILVSEDEKNTQL